jgi:small basic protein
MTELTEKQGHKTFEVCQTIILWAGMLVFTGHACTHMVAAGDTWVALACGRHHVNHGVNTVEPFSAHSHKPGPTEATMRKFAHRLRTESIGKEGFLADTKRWYADKADNFGQWPEWFKSFAKWFHPTGWVNQNWGTHAMFYWLSDTFGGDGEYDYNYDMMIVWKFFVNIIQVICIYYIGRVLGVSRPLSAVSAASAMYIARTFIDVRPAVFSNVFTAVFILILVLAIHRNALYIWLTVPLTVFWCNVHGGYIYLFMIFVLFFVMNLLGCISAKKFVTVGKKGLYHTMGAGAACFIAMLLLNPYHLTNLTHTFEVTISKHAEDWRTVQEWHPAFEWSNLIGEEEAFLVMFIIGWVVLALWIVARFFKPAVQRQRRSREAVKEPPGQYQWPKIDLTTIVIAAFTVNMAVKSRRFIPVAAIAACPLIAIWIEQSVKMIGSRICFNRTGKLTAPVVPLLWRKYILAVLLATTMFLGIIWGAKFKRIYLDPWHRDGVRDSIFMRMTASNLKPFEICQFIRDNNLKGKVFNYWTEGGALAFGQRPDPETGRTSLRLFMDGRSQAAYEHKDFNRWRYIKGGGPYYFEAAQAGRAKKLTSKDKEKIGKWIDGQLKSANAWMVIMPSAERKSHFVQCLQTMGNWRIAFINDRQQMLVDVNTDMGRDLIVNLGDPEKVKFPDEFSRMLTLGSNALRSRDPSAVAQGYSFAKRAFDIFPCQASAMLMSLAGTRSTTAQRIAQDLARFLDDFIKNRETYSKQGGHEQRLLAAWISANHMMQLGKNLKLKPEMIKKYKKLSGQLIKDQYNTAVNSKW